MNSPHDLVYLIPFMLFLIAYFFLSQKIYLRNQFIPAFAASLIITGIMLAVSNHSDYIKAITSGSFLFFYVCILLGIKKTYPHFNSFFIQKKWIKKKFRKKEYTWVELTEWGDDIWDKKNAAPPSWLDYAFTVILLLLPMLLAIDLLDLLNFLF